MVVLQRKLWVDPVSSRASRRSPFTITRRGMVFSIRIPATAWRETTKALASGGSWIANSSARTTIVAVASLAGPASATM